VTGGGVLGNTDKIPGTTPTPVTYGSDWAFDSTLRINVCSDYDGTNSIQCIIQNLKVKYYAYSSILSVMDFANQGSWE